MRETKEKTGKGRNRTENRHRKPKGEVRIHFKELGKKTKKLRGIRVQREAERKRL